MQVKSVFCLILCLILFLSSCTKAPSEPDLSSSTAVTTTEAETTVPFPSKLTYESTTVGDYGTVAGSDSEKHKVFVNYEWVVSTEFFRCYYNPKNLEEPYYKENRYGIADKDGNIIIKPQFGFIRPVAKDRFLVANGTKSDYSEFEGSEYAVINSRGEIIIPFVPYIEYMVGYYDGLESTYFCVRIDSEKYYLVDNNGNMVYDMYFTSFRVAHPEMYYADKVHTGVCDGKIYSFDQNLNIIKVLDEKPVVSEKIYTYNNMEYFKTVCYKKGNYYYGLTNKTTGREIVPCKYEEITVFARNRILASETRGLDNTEWKYAIYDLGGTVICPEGKYSSIDIYEWDDGNVYQPVGIASAPNPNGDKIYGEWYEWLVDKNGTRISDTYRHIYYNQYGEMAGYYTADRGDRVFYLNRYGKVVSTIGQ